MRVVQLIDSLRCGGAERIAVSCANLLSGKIGLSGIGVTRKGGLLQEEILPEVESVFLRRNTRFDLQAMWRLHTFLKQNRIELLHAHGTSIFIGLLMKETLPGLRLIWHDHYGKELEGRSAGLLKIFAPKIDAVISVNEQLKDWAKNELNCVQVIRLRNFLSPVEVTKTGRNLDAPHTFRLICLANFRQQKDHLNLLKAFRILSAKRNGLSLHLLGRVQEGAVFTAVQNYIRKYQLSRVYLYKEQAHPETLVRQGDLGVLASKSEGLPLALLEYGRQGLPVVCTKVGDCESLVAPYGRLVNPGDPPALAAAIYSYLDDETGRKQDAANFQTRVLREYTEAAVLPQILELYEWVLGDKATRFSCSES